MEASGPLVARCVTSPAAEAGVAALLALTVSPVAFWLAQWALLALLAGLDDAPAPLALAFTVALAGGAAIASLRRAVWRSGVLSVAGEGVHFLADADRDAGQGAARPLQRLRVTDLGPVLLLSWAAADGPGRARLHARHHTPAAWSAWRQALGCRP